MSTPKPLKLVSLHLSGFLGVPPTKTVRVDRIGHRNVFIGQNNAGKSLPLRFLLLFIRGAMEASALWSRRSLGQVYPESLWGKDKTSQATAEIGFSAPYDDMETNMQAKAPSLRFSKNGVWHLQAIVKFPADDHNAVLQFTPLVEHAGILRPLCQFGDVNPNQLRYIDTNGQYTEQSTSVAETIKELITPLFLAWLNGCRFFEPLRGLERPSNKRKDDQLIEDGSSLIGEMNTLQNYTATRDDLDKWTATVCSKLSKLFTPSYSHLQVRGQPPEMELVQNVPGSLPLPLRHLGTGVQQLIIAYARLVKDRTQHKTYFFEEPESNLHPKLLRGFIRDLADYETIQFFITTHSSALLDSLGRDDQVYHFAQDAQGACSATLASDILTRHDILDALGVNGSSLLQVNCVVWVEGPSDRLYVRRWLDEYSQRTGDAVREGIEYSFLFYGGSVMSHFAFEPTDEEVQQWICLILISRFSAVLMDKNGRLTDTQERFLDEATKDKVRRFVRHSDGREIENDIDRGVFLQGVAEYLGVEGSALTNVSLDGTRRYMDQIAEHLPGNDVERQRIRDKLSRKVNLATKVLACADNKTLGCPSYIDGLCEFIRRSRLNDVKTG